MFLRHIIDSDKEGYLQPLKYASLIVCTFFTTGAGFFVFLPSEFIGDKIAGVSALVLGFGCFASIIYDTLIYPYYKKTTSIT